MRWALMTLALTACLGNIKQDSGDVIDTGNEVTDSAVQDSANEDTGSEDTGSDTGVEEDTSEEDTGDVDELSPDEQMAQDIYDETVADLPPLDVTDPNTIGELANASAPNLYLLQILPNIMASMAIQSWQMTGNTGLPPCPVFNGYDDEGQPIEGEDVSITGGCTDHNGDEWFGEMRQVLDEIAMQAHIVYDGWGATQDAEGCPGLRATNVSTGIIKMSSDPMTEAVQLDTVMVTQVDGYDEENGCVEQDSDIAMNTVITLLEEDDLSTTDDSDSFSTYNGGGEFALHQSNGLSGIYSVNTVDEVMNDAICQYEALSGSTTLSSDGHESVITYDGETDCDEAATVMWSVDGGPETEIEGIACSATALPKGFLALFAAIGGLVFLRRRD